MLDKKDRRAFLRFPASLKLELTSGERNIPGLVKDFSRKGGRFVFDNCDFDRTTYIDFKIQLPQKDSFVPASAKVVWEKESGGKCETGVLFQNFPAELKAEILEYGYSNWINSNLPFSLD